MHVGDERHHVLNALLSITFVVHSSVFLGLIHGANRLLIWHPC